MQWLVEVLGVDVNATDQLDWTALHSAARVGRTDICLYLIARGADVEVSSSSGCLALNYFIRHCDTRDRLELLAALTLLCPAREDLLALNDRGLPILCLHSLPYSYTLLSTTLPPFLLLMSARDLAISSSHTHSLRPLTVCLAVFRRSRPLLSLLFLGLSFSSLLFLSRLVATPEFS